MKKIVYAFILLLPTLLSAQTGAERLQLPTTPRRYFTQKNHQRLMTLDKDMARRRAFIDMSATQNGAGLSRDVTIPVVVHVLYKSGTNTNKLPSESDIRQQLDIAGQDFRQTAAQNKHEADTKEHFLEKNGMDTRISFCLASQTPSGTKTNGFEIAPTSITTWASDDKMKSATTGGLNAWDPDKYLNIWVVNFADSIAGYAQMPGGQNTTDGIVIDARYFGKKATTDKKMPYTEGKTLTHLIGSYLNLYELWSETVPCGDDGVDDTPIHNAPTLGNVAYRHVSTCNGNPVAMSMNFMDNTNDSMQYMFTIGQKKRMQTTLIKGGARYNLTVWGDSICSKNNAQQVVQALQSDNNVKPTLPTTSIFNYRIYPNPAQDRINLDIDINKAGNAEFTVFNAQGSIQKQIRYDINEGTQSFNMSVSDWSPGVYLIRLSVNDIVKTEKLIISK